jgi:drug/metabolite transporter (DMT)-like permease
MNLLNPILYAFITAFLLAIGQILFKVGSEKWEISNISTTIITFVTNPFLIIAIVLYAVTIVLWIYVLKQLPLTVAYPITALSFIIVPMLSSFYLDEKVTIYTFIGGVLVILGVLLTQYKLE